MSTQLLQLTNEEAWEIHTVIVSMAPIAYYFIGSIPDIVNNGSLSSPTAPLMTGYTLTIYPTLPFWFWLVICNMTPTSWGTMLTFYNISLFGPWWLYIFAP